MSNHINNKTSEDDTFISVTSTNETKKIKFYHINIDNAVDRDNYEKINMKDRLPKIIEKIKNDNPDIISMQELRTSKNVKNPLKILFELSDDYDFVYGFRNPSQLSFAQAILYKKGSFFAIDQKIIHINETGTPSKVAFDNIKENIVNSKYTLI